MIARRPIPVLLAFLVAVASAGPVPLAFAGLSRAEISGVGFDDRAGRPLPDDALTNDATGASLPLARRLDGEPALVAFVDYTCETVCGVAANALAAAEQKLASRSDLPHRVLVLGFDPRDDAADRAAWLWSNPEAASLGLANFLLADAATTQRIVRAGGFRTAYDAGRDQFAHPAGALLLDPDGRIVRALDLVSLEPGTLRLALIEASGGTAGTLIERAILSCYGWNAQTGRYAPLIDVTLTAAGATTVLAILGLIGLFLLRERRKRASDDGPVGAGEGAGAAPDQDERGRRLVEP